MVAILRYRNKNIRGRIIDSKTDIYCDQLSNILEKYVGKKKNY